MTVQRRFLVEPHDIVALEYECRKCHSRYTLRVDSNSKTQKNCPGCGVSWVHTEYTQGPEPVDIAIPQFIEALRRLKSAASESVLRLEVTLPPDDPAGRAPAV